MEESHFQKELGKYRTVRRAEHIGGGLQNKNKKTTSQFGSSSSSAKSKQTTTPGPTTAATNSSSTKDAIPTDLPFWDALLVYLKNRMPENEAATLFQACKELHEVTSKGAATNASSPQINS
jgi:hypothetical protein